MSKRKWNQFGLRSFLLAVFTIGVIAGWLVSAEKTHKREVVALESVSSHASAVTNVKNLRDGSETSRREGMIFT
ncbi:MAG: hypothetical protein AAF456_08315 [Planctomycetota bacterium]